MSRLWRRLSALALAPTFVGCALWNRAFHGAWLGPERVQIATVAVAAASESRKGAGGLQRTADGRISIQERTGLLAQDAARGAIQWLEKSGRLKVAQIPESAYTLAPPSIVLGFGKVQPLPEPVTQSLAASKSDAYLLVWAEEGQEQGRSGVKVWSVLYAKDGAPMWRHYFFAAKPEIALGGGFGVAPASKNVANVQGGNMAKSMVKSLGGRLSR